MISKGHKKHSALAKREFGFFAPNEWAITGTTCEVIKELAERIFSELLSTYKCAYIDASHNEETHSSGSISSNNVATFTSHNSFNEWSFSQKKNQYNFHNVFSEYDFVLVNGNHHQAKNQIIVIDSKKQSSLEKRIPQLTNVELILLKENDKEVFDSIKTSIKNTSEIPIYNLSEISKIILFLKQKMIKRTPVINGLVLSGGRSLRMGYDKSKINWHGKEQRYHIADLLTAICCKTFISCREDQLAEIDTKYSAIPDTFIGLGPLGAILSAFREQPNDAWLVVACDLPLLDSEMLGYLIKNRKTSSIATAFESSFDGHPEPLITIWEPKSYPLLLSYLSQGFSCPRKVLINCDSHVVKPLNGRALENVNTPEDVENIKSIFR